MSSLSIVIPALNEVHNLEPVIRSIPFAALSHRGWNTEVIVVDNASSDGTGDEARRLGARVVLEAARGYGNAYKAGFAAARGDFVLTGDADRTYPLDQAVGLLDHLLDNRLDFLSTNRLHSANRAAFKRSHTLGNVMLSAVSRVLFANDFRDSQSGMWIFRRSIWSALDVRSSGMAFSQELKNEASRAGFSCGEVPIAYRPRAGEVKLNAVRDGVRNLSQLLRHRLRHATGTPVIQVVGPIASPGERYGRLQAGTVNGRLEEPA